MDVKFPPLHNSNTLKIEEESECCSSLNVAAQIAENVTVFTAESWCCGPTAALPGGLYRHILLLHIYVEFVFTVLKHSHLFQIEI